MSVSLKFTLIPVVYLFIAISLVYSSCLRESKCDCEADTLKFATIFRPDAISGKDAIIENTLPNSNFGDFTLCTIFAWTSGGFFTTARSLVEFDLSQIPVNTKIKAAKLSLYWASYDNLTEQTGSNYFSIYRVTQPWDEYSVTWNNQPSTSEVHKVDVGKSKSVDQSYLNIDVTDLVQDMIDDPNNSYGFMLKLDDEIPYKLVVTASSDNPDSNKHPKLIIYF